jgi:hypothetical protein
MGVFEMVVAIVAISTIGRVVQSYHKGRAGGAAKAEIQELRSAVESNELRLIQAEEKVADLTEKLTFVESLLASPERHSQLPPSSR